MWGGGKQNASYIRYASNLKFLSYSGKKSGDELEQGDLPTMALWYVKRKESSF